MTAPRALGVGVLILACLIGPSCGKRGGSGGGGPGVDSGAVPRDARRGPGLSGLERERLLSQLDSGEVMQLCDWVIDLVGDGTTVMCEGGFMVNGPTHAECIDTYTRIIDGCARTVGEAEDCYTLIAPDFCLVLTMPPQCQHLLDCTS